MQPPGIRRLGLVLTITALADPARASNQQLVRQELPKFITTMKPQIAQIITLPDFNTTLTVTRMERVADMMQQLGGLPAKVNITAMVKSMFYPPPAGS